MSTPIQVRDSSLGIGGGYLDVAGENLGDGTAAILTTTGRSGLLIPFGSSAPMVLKVGRGELISVTSVSDAPANGVFFYDASAQDQTGPQNLIYQGTPTAAPTIIDFPFEYGLVMDFDDPSSTNLRVVLV